MKSNSSNQDLARVVQSLSGIVLALEGSHAAISEFLINNSSIPDSPKKRVLLEQLAVLPENTKGALLAMNEITERAAQPPRASWLWRLFNR